MCKCIKIFEKITRAIAFGLVVIAGISLMLMMLQSVLDVFMDNIFGAPIEGNLEVISIYHMVLVVFLALAYVEIKHEHISADLFVRLMPPILQKICYVFGCIISLLFFGALTYQTGIDAIASFNITEVVMGSIYIVVWPAKVALPIGFGAMCLVVVLHMIKTITDKDFDPTPTDPIQESI